MVVRTFCFSYWRKWPSICFGIVCFCKWSNSEKQKIIGVCIAYLSIPKWIALGVFPLEEGVSWESHLFGAIVGILLSFLFKNEGPQADPPKIWEEETEENTIDEYLNL